MEAISVAFRSPKWKCEEHDVEKNPVFESKAMRHADQYEESLSGSCHAHLTEPSRTRKTLRDSIQMVCRMCFWAKIQLTTIHLHKKRCVSSCPGALQSHQTCFDPLTFIEMWPIKACIWDSHM
mmetsp:Transcript_65780/g.183232  ORF Transcript_65780/g.183232 Transcript_65780/m.183232 type:complete len:123 (-) Transcript_65780:26-394(-)